MNRRVSLEQLLQATALQPAEAVAIVQQLIVTRTPHDLTPPLGPPTPATVFVGADGSVSCGTSDATFAVSELAALLDAILPAGGTLSAGVPGGLRYTVARARMEVDAPPFDSTDDLSRALARHERGDRTAVIQRLIARTNRPGAENAVDRRRADPAVAQLRRQLRDADARVYDQQRAIDTLSVMSAQPPSSKRSVAVVAGILIGLTFTGVGGMMRNRPLPSPPSPPPAAVARPVTETVAPAPVVKPATQQTTKTDERPAPKKVSRVSSKMREREPARPRRFQWLRTRFVFRSDPL